MFNFNNNIQLRIGLGFYKHNLQVLLCCGGEIEQLSGAKVMHSLKCMEIILLHKRCLTASGCLAFIIEETVDRGFPRFDLKIYIRRKQLLYVP